MIVCKQCDAQNPNDNAFCENCGEPLGASDTIGGLETPDYPTDGGGHGASTAKASIELEPGTVFADRYTIVEKLGQGGMGTVYKASEMLGSQERAIALKLIRADRLADQRAVDKLVNEGVLTQEIRHPNVVNVYNVGTSDGTPYVAMELVKGVSLREWHRRQIGAGQDVPFDTAAAIVRELVNGLEAAHDLKIIHRDLKPENVMLTAEPEGTDVKLQILDFGIARAPGTIETGTGLGTPHYMAPEQITTPDSAGPAADFYSVFKIWYELLMDVLPQGHWQPPSTGRPDVQPLVDQLIERGLSAKPSRRPQDAAQFRKWMRTAIPGFPGIGGDEAVDGGGGGYEQHVVESKGGSNVDWTSFNWLSWIDEDKRPAARKGCLWLLVIVMVIAVIDSCISDDEYVEDQGEILVGPGTEGPGDLAEEILDDGEETNDAEMALGPAALTGSWSNGQGALRVNVTPEGNFYGEADTGHVLSGNLVAGTWTLGFNGEPPTAGGAVAYAGDCRLSFSGTNIHGAPAGDNYVVTPDGGECP